MNGRSIGHQRKGSAVWHLYEWIRKVAMNLELGRIPTFFWKDHCRGKGGGVMGQYCNHKPYKQLEKKRVLKSVFSRWPFKISSHSIRLHESPVIRSTRWPIYLSGVSFGFNFVIFQRIFCTFNTTCPHVKNFVSEKIVKIWRVNRELCAWVKTAILDFRPGKNTEISKLLKFVGK